MVTITTNFHWLEHPFKYDYLRKSYYQCFSRRYFKKGQKVRGVSEDFYKLVGYRYLGVSNELDRLDGYQGLRIYHYEIYWLKKYDRGCPNEHPNYATGKRMPSEACLVKELE